jgi:hypothetical protein
MRVKAKWITQEVLQITCKCGYSWIYTGDKKPGDKKFIVNCYNCETKLKIIGTEDNPIEVKGVDKVV